MRTRYLALAAAITLAACSLFRPPPAPTLPPSPTPTAGPALTPTLTPNPTPAPSPTPPATATLDLPTLVPATPFPASDFSVRVHPEGGLFPGDLLSFEVIASGEVDLSDREISASLADGTSLSTAGFGGFGIGGRQQATLQWAWNTTGLEPGDYAVVFDVKPGDTVFTETVTLLPESLHAFPEPGAAWAVTESDCCLVYYVTGTAAERDLDALLEQADAEAESAVEQIGVAFDEAITIVFLPRVLGHGGFAGGEIYISYLDRNYAGSGPSQVLHHEMIHILDGRKGGDFRPSIFVEGLAVLLSGGHFKPEPIVPRAAALLTLEQAYIPLTELTDAFYQAQHEISYLEGAALIQYMVDTWGWDAFEAFYRGMQEPPGGQPLAAINQGLQIHFDTGFDELESAFLDYLSSQPEDSLAREDIRLTVAFYDTVRRYQQALDPSAYFLTAWLLGIDSMVERQVVADYLRHPSSPENIALETLLVTADQQLRAMDYTAAARTLAAVNAVLDGLEAGDEWAFYADPLATDYLALTLAALDAGYEPQRIEVRGENAVVEAVHESVELVKIEFVRKDEGWVFDTGG